MVLLVADPKLPGHYTLHHHCSCLAGMGCLIVRKDCMSHSLGFLAGLAGRRNPDTTIEVSYSS